MAKKYGRKVFLCPFDGKPCDKSPKGFCLWEYHDENDVFVTGLKCSRLKHDEKEEELSYFDVKNEKEAVKSWRKRGRG